MNRRDDIRKLTDAIKTITRTEDGLRKEAGRQIQVLDEAHAEAARKLTRKATDQAAEANRERKGAADSIMRSARDRIHAIEQQRDLDLAEFQRSYRSTMDELEQVYHAEEAQARTDCQVAKQQVADWLAGELAPHQDQKRKLSERLAQIAKGDTQKEVSAQQSPQTGPVEKLVAAGFARAPQAPETAADAPSDDDDKTPTT